CEAPQRFRGDRPCDQACCQPGVIDPPPPQRPRRVRLGRPSSAQQHAALAHLLPIWKPKAVAFLAATIVGGIVAPLAVMPSTSGPHEPPIQLTVNLRWWVVERSDWKNPATVTPPYWRVYFDATGWDCAHSRSIRWYIDGTLGPTVCSFHHDFPALGSHDLKFSAVSAAGVAGTYHGVIVLRDLLIVSIGDSVASGEGNPPFTNYQCDRSNAAGAVQAAMKLIPLDDHTTVTLLNVACTGATIEKGLIGPQFSGVRAQIQQVRDEIRGRPISALLLSVGANDIGFAKIAKACAKLGHCSKRKRFVQEVKDKLGVLRTLFGKLNACLTVGPCIPSDGPPIEPLRISSARIFITQYFDPTRDDNGLTCNRILLLWPFGIDRRDLDWARSGVIEPLNH